MPRQPVLNEHGVVWIVVVDRPQSMRSTNKLSIVRMSVHENTTRLVRVYLSSTLPGRKLGFGLASDILDHAHTVHDDEPLVKHRDLEHRVIVL